MHNDPTNATDPAGLDQFALGYQARDHIQKLIPKAIAVDLGEITIPGLNIKRNMYFMVMPNRSTDRIFGWQDEVTNNIALGIHNEGQMTFLYGLSDGWYCEPMNPNWLSDDQWAKVFAAKRQHLGENRSGPPEVTWFRRSALKNGWSEEQVDTVLRLAITTESKIEAPPKHGQHIWCLNWVNSFKDALDIELRKMGEPGTTGVPKGTVMTRVIWDVPKGAQGNENGPAQEHTTLRIRMRDDSVWYIDGGVLHRILGKGSNELNNLGNGKVFITPGYLMPPKGWKTDPTAVY
jgi:hypothetical protein